VHCTACLCGACLHVHDTANDMCTSKHKDMHARQRAYTRSCPQSYIYHMLDAHRHAKRHTEHKETYRALRDIQITQRDIQSTYKSRGVNSVCSACTGHSHTQAHMLVCTHAHSHAHTRLQGGPCDLAAPTRELAPAAGQHAAVHGRTLRCRAQRAHSCNCAAAGAVLGAAL